MAAMLNALTSAARMVVGLPPCDTGAPAPAPGAAWPRVPLKPPADPGRPCPLLPPVALLSSTSEAAAAEALLPLLGSGSAAGQATAPRSAASCQGVVLQRQDVTPLMVQPTRASPAPQQLEVATHQAAALSPPLAHLRVGRLLGHRGLGRDEGLAAQLKLLERLGGQHTPHSGGCDEVM